MGIYVGWVARKGSFSESMPICNEKGDVTLIFSGEDYPEPGTIGELRRKGHSVPNEGPSYLVHLYEDDPAFPTGLNGFFQGLVVDQSRGTAVLFNDRYGMQRIYWHESSAGCYFAAEAKAILAVCPETRSLDRVALGEVISCGCALENRSLFEGVSLVPAGSCWLFRGASLRSRVPYFHARRWEEQESADPETYYRELRDVISTNMPRYLPSGRRVAVALTGGLDTRVIMAMAKAPPGTLPCYTYGGSLRDSRDVLIARQVAAICRQPHDVLSVGAEFLSRFPHYAERSTYLTDGCVSVGNSPDLYLSERARELSSTKVVGTWGSELLRQVATFKPSMPDKGLFPEELMKHVSRARSTYERIRDGHPITFAAFRQTPWAQYAVEALEQTQLSVCAPFLNNDFVRIIYRSPRVGQADVRGRLIRDGDPRLARLPSDRGVYAQGANWARGMAGRLLQEFTFKAEYACDMGMPQWLARVDKVLSPISFDRLFLGRHKFLHFRRWYRVGLSDYVKQILLDGQTLARPCFLRKGVESVVSEHTRGVSNHTNTIHCLLTLELLQRQIASIGTQDS
jgi:asparagine synthase (glutamine-hydrolysing)